MDLFDTNVASSRYIPLAERMRPQKIEDILGQDHLLKKGKPLFEAINKDVVPSMILYGPPGSGKTTIARVIANYTKSNLESMNAVIDGIPKIKEIVNKANDDIKFYGQKTILFIDEIHRLNKTQQDALLPYLENGLIVLIGATTENPFVELNSALISRLLLFKLNKLKSSDLRQIIELAISDDERGFGKLEISFENKDKLFDYLVFIGSGDVRKSLNALEQLVNMTSVNSAGSYLLSYDKAKMLVENKSLYYDKSGDNHYDIISAFIKSVRGSDVDAALHYLARMIEGGEDPLFIARRLIILASEDIGLADSQGLTLAVSCAEALKLIGMPEGRLVLAHTTIYLAKAPKSNSAYLAINKAQEDIRSKDIGHVPLYLTNKGDGYIYPHDFEEKDFIVKQNYLPGELKGIKYYLNKKFDK